MPDTAAEPGATAANMKPTRAVNPDMVGEELADNANIWHVYDRVAKEDDERRTKAWDNGLNNLALFAGLFSAVTTAFIIEAQHDMQPDYAQLTFLVLNATASGHKFVQKPFVVPPDARVVSCLWVASLVLSLSAALIAIMGKDWIGMYTARPVCGLRQWAEMRAYRLRCVEQWHMSGVIAAAPVLLHISLLLFGAGLVVFISADPLTHHLTLGLSLATGVLYFITTVSAAVFSASPFKSPATQMFRAALSTFLTYLGFVLCRPKRNIISTVLRDLNRMVVGRAEDSESVGVLLPGGTIGRHHPYARHSPAAMLSAVISAAVTHVRSLPSSLRTQWSRARSGLRSVPAAFDHIPLKDWFLSSTWTDLPAERRPNLLAEALSWLGGASQAPEVFRAIIFALGDLDIGPLVGRHIGLELRTRLRAEICRTSQQVDFLTLSRYVLADQNILGDPVLDLHHFVDRFGRSLDPALRCEDGLAALIKVTCPYPSSPVILPGYCPDRVTQPRMMEFLLPSIPHTTQLPLQAVIILASRYRTHFLTPGSFNPVGLEAHIYRLLDPATCRAYNTEVMEDYGGDAGAIELLTFLCCNGHVLEVNQKAAVELIVELLEHSPGHQHRCLAYLLGKDHLRRAVWGDKIWSSGSLSSASHSLSLSRGHVFELNPMHPRSDDLLFASYLAHTAVMFLSPKHDTFSDQQEWIEFLFGQLRHSQSILGTFENLDVLGLLLEHGALLTILRNPAYMAYEDNSVNCGTAILVDIIGCLVQLLRESNTRTAERLFAQLAFTEIKGEDGGILTWDLGEWLRTQAPEILRTHRSSTTVMQGVHDSLTALGPLCEGNDNLRVHWDRIGYPGRPGDVFSDPFLDIGRFFANAENRFLY